MTTIVISDVAEARPRMFESPGVRAFNVSNSPIGEIEFSNLLFAIASKLNTDENFITISCTLPQGFVYRLRYAMFQLSGVAANDIQQHEPAASCLLTENQVTVYNFAMYNESSAQNSGLADAEGGANLGVAFKSNQDAVTNDFSAFYSPIWANIARVVIDASQGVSIFNARLLNSSGEATSAMNISYRFEFDMFTIAQFTAVDMNRSILTY